MIYIGIDPALSCGWAMLNDGGQRIDSGVWNLKHDAGEGEGMRYVKMRKHLGELLNRAGDVDPLLLAYEWVPHHQSNASARSYARLTGVLLEQCEMSHVNYTKLTVSEIKQAATGKGSATKAQMIEAARERWEVTCATDDEADALWVAEASRRKWEVAA